MDATVLVVVEQRQRQRIDIDAVDRHRERDPQLVIELGQRAKIFRVAEADLIDAARTKKCGL